MKRKQAGFTLIELLVVIAVLGILVGVAVPRVIGAIANANTNANAANLAIVQSAVERFYVANNDTYPAQATLAAQLVPTYLKELPTHRGGSLVLVINATTGIVTWGTAP